MLLVANKSDLLTIEDCPYKEDVKDWAEKERVKLIQTSAKTGSNIELIFEVMACDLDSGSHTDL